MDVQVLEVAHATGNEKGTENDKTNQAFGAEATIEGREHARISRARNRLHFRQTGAPDRSDGAGGGEESPGFEKEDCRAEKSRGLTHRSIAEGEWREAIMF